MTGPRQVRTRTDRQSAYALSAWPATPKKKAASSTPQPSTSADLASTTSPTSPTSTANELGAILVAAGLSLPRDHALVSLLALNGLRVSEAIGATIERSAKNAATAP